MAHFDKDEIVIEVDIRRIIDDEKHGKITVGNGDLYFYPINDTVRSKIIPQRSVGSGTKPVWNNIQSIPGQRIHCNPKAMKARITDALNDEENKLILAQVVRAEKDASGGIRPLGGGISGGQKEIPVRLNSPEELHNFLYWMVRAVDENKANLIQGTLPTERALRDGGDIRIPGDPEIAKRENGGSYYMRPTPKETVAA